MNGEPYMCVGATLQLLTKIGTRVAHMDEEGDDDLEECDDGMVYVSVYAAWRHTHACL